MKRFLLAVTVLAAITAAAVTAMWFAREPLVFWASDQLDRLSQRYDAGPQPQPAHYRALKKEAEQWRSQLASRHQAATTKEAKAAIEQEARIVLEHLLPSMMRCWIGTGWDFNGTSETPGSGKIACGYFVATVLRDAGYDVNRYRLAQQASANIIHTFIKESDCSLSVGSSYEDFQKMLAEKPDGIYIVGLDTHVAFLIKTGGSFRFIHSSGSKPWQVVDESPAEAMVLAKSSWRMLGHFSGSDDAIRKWLKGERLKVVRR